MIIQLLDAQMNQVLSFLYSQSTEGFLGNPIANPKNDV